jgi:pyruvate dehydrogenase E2 component (dihydrolipoamide acetyltransferase)
MDRKIPAKGIRKAIAKRMAESWATSPAYLMLAELDTTNLNEFRESLQEVLGRKISVNAILLKALAKALEDFPYVNASYRDEMIILHENINVGFAVSVDDGLIVPNVKDVNQKSYAEVADDMDRLIDACRTGKLSMDDITGGTFTVTNMAATNEIVMSVPIINQPELAIIAVYLPKDKPVAVDGEVVIRPMMNLCLSSDHRIIDGVMSGNFLARVKALLLNPNEIEV